MAANAGEKILPARLGGVFESLSSASGLQANKDLAQAIMKSNESLVGHVTGVMPQIYGGKLDWVLGGSAAVNALAGARNLTILEASKLPAIVPARTVSLGNDSIAAYQNFVRRVGDLDAFVVNGGKDRFLKSPYLGLTDLGLPEAANAALKATGEFRTSPLIQAVKMNFASPEIAAIDYAGRTVYVNGPGQLMGNKMRQVLMSYAPVDAGKLTGDFSHLLDAAKGIYTERELIAFGHKALNRNSLLYGRDIVLPWDKSAENTKFLDFLRTVIESEAKNGAFLKGLNIDSRHSIDAMRLFQRHPLGHDKAALAGFINRHAEFVAKLDLRGSAEREIYLQHGGKGRAFDTFMNMLNGIPSRSKAGEKAVIKQQLKFMDAQLIQDANLPALASKFKQAVK